MPDCDNNGNDANCILVSILGDFHAGMVVRDAMQILLDLDTGKVYNSAEIDWTFIGSGEPANEEAFNMCILNAYYNIVSGGDSIMWSERETREHLSADRIAAINNILS